MSGSNLRTLGKRIEKYQKFRSRWFNILVGFSIGAIFNQVPFLNWQELETVTQVQWIFLIIDVVVVIIAVIIYIVYSYRIRRIKQAIEEDVLEEK